MKAGAFKRKTWSSIWPIGSKLFWWHGMRLFYPILLFHVMALVYFLLSSQTSLNGVRYYLFLSRNTAGLLHYIWNNISILGLLVSLGVPPLLWLITFVYFWAAKPSRSYTRRVQVVGKKCWRRCNKKWP